jgi:hypothetical protein
MVAAYAYRNRLTAAKVADGVPHRAPKREQIVTAAPIYNVLAKGPARENEPRKASGTGSP